MQNPSVPVAVRVLGGSGVDVWRLACLFGDECQRLGVAGPDDSETAPIEAGDLGQVEALADCEHYAVGGAQRQVLVGQHEVGGALVVLVVSSTGHSVPSASEVRNWASTAGPPSRTAR
jgi:hypothetical protein